MKFKFFLNKIHLVFIIAVFFAVPSNFIFAQSEADIKAQEAKLQAEYDELQKDIAKWQGILDDTRKKAGSLQGDITGLNAKIKEAELTIQAKNIAIAKILKEINTRTKKISELEKRLEKGHESLAELLRQTNEVDSYTLPEVVLTNSNISDFFHDLDSFTSIKRSLKEHFAEVREVKAATEEERAQLGAKKNEETDAKYIVENRKKVITKSQEEKKELLSITNQQAKAYQEVLAERQKKAAQIRAALFRLRDSEGIPFGKALEYANFASQKTGIRPALILAILSQESDLGKNQGSCILSSIETGDGIGKNTGTFFEKVMKSPRDTIPFESITKRLGRDWTLTPVSCPPGAVYSANRGYGGGMGPSQFIPSTWELFKERIGQMVGMTGEMADPWNPEHSFTATAIYLSDLGAIGGSYTSERNAACRYYSGRSCDSKRPANSFYGNSVMTKVEEIQTNIDFLKGV